MVIDPHHVVRQDLATFFGDDGYDVVVHPRAAGALALIRRVQPTVVLIELHLEYPQAGLDVVRALRADPATTELPLVVWSTDLDVACRVAALHLPDVTVVSKYDDHRPPSGQRWLRRPEAGRGGPPTLNASTSRVYNDLDDSAELYPRSSA